MFWRLKTRKKIIENSLFFTEVFIKVHDNGQLWLLILAMWTAHDSIWTTVKSLI